MKNEFKTYIETKKFLNKVEEAINDYIKPLNSTNFLPEDLQQKVNDFLISLQSYDIEKLKPNLANSNEFFVVDILAEGISKATGHKWSHSERDIEDIFDLEFTPEDIEKTKGFRPDAVKVIDFDRNDTISRGELDYLHLVLMPKCAYIVWQAIDGQKGWTDVCSTPESLLEQLSKV